jgi:hypothetical protein
LDRGGAAWFVRLALNGPRKRSRAPQHVRPLAPRDLGDGSYTIAYSPGGGNAADVAAAHLTEYRGSERHEGGESHKSYRDYTVTVELALSAADVAMGFGAGGSGSSNHDPLSPNHDPLSPNHDPLSPRDLDAAVAAYYAPGGMAQRLCGGDLAVAREPLWRFAEGGGGGGLVGEYFENPWFYGATAHVRIDPTIDLALPVGLPAGPYSGSGSGAVSTPPPGVGSWPGVAAALTATPRGTGGSSGVGVRWTGFLRAPATANFSMALDLGAFFSSALPPGAPSASARLFLDDELLLARDSADEDRAAHAAHKGSSSSSEGGAASAGVVGGSLHASVALEDGVLYKVRVEYSLRAGEVLNLVQAARPLPARCRLLWWAKASPRNVVPAFFLWPKAAPIDSAPLPLKVFF